MFASFENELGMTPVMTPTPTALNMMSDTAAIATIGLTRLCVADIVASWFWRIVRLLEPISYAAHPARYVRDFSPQQ